jgi:hypothetical protein
MNALEYEPLGKGTIMGHDVSADEAIWDDACALDLKHVFHSWQAQADRHPVEVTGGHGAWLQYADGREMLDLTSQQVNVNIGYQHPEGHRGHPPGRRRCCARSARITPTSLVAAPHRWWRAAPRRASTRCSSRTPARTPTRTPSGR